MGNEEQSVADAEEGRAPCSTLQTLCSIPDGESERERGYWRLPFCWYQYAQWSQYLSGTVSVTRSSRSGPTNCKFHANQPSQHPTFELVSATGAGAWIKDQTMEECSDRN